ncbi:MAG: ClpXP protease specificity-enhancing factor SspB [Xanthomonadaceae bacterium]|nr:ClpXP protease specificity-enhancing factor SspB [Xanthomonadaceae bacterium]
MMTDFPANMSPSRPYLLRALHEWIVDNAATPQIVVDGTHADVQVPENLRSTEKIVLNLSPSAVSTARKSPGRQKNKAANRRSPT